MSDYPGGGVYGPEGLTSKKKKIRDKTAAFGDWWDQQNASPTDLINDAISGGNDDYQEALAGLQASLSTTYSPMMEELGNLDPISWLEGQELSYTPVTESSQYDNFDEWLQSLQSPEYQQQYQQGQADYVGNMMSNLFGIEDYQQYTGDLRSQTDTARGAIEDFDPYGELPPEVARELQREIDQMSAETMEIVDSLAGSGRSMQSFRQLDQLSNQIQGAQYQKRTKYIEQNLAKKQLEYENLQNQYQYMTQMGMRGAEQYAQQIQNQQMLTLQGYSQEMQALMTENQQNLALYEQHYESVYNNIMANMSYDAHQFAMSSELYGQIMGPIYDELNAMMQAEQLEMQQQANEDANALVWGKIIFGGLQILAGIFIPGAQALIGTGAATMGSGFGSSSGTGGPGFPGANG